MLFGIMCGGRDASQGDQKTYECDGKRTAQSSGGIEAPGYRTQTRAAYDLGGGRAQLWMLLMLKVSVRVPSSPARGPIANVKSQGPPEQSIPESPVKVKEAAGVEAEPFPEEAI